MTAHEPPAPAPFTPAERDYIRRELDMFFSTLPSVAEGFHLKRWQGGPQADQPKVPQAAAGLLERGLLPAWCMDRLVGAEKLGRVEAGLLC